MTGDITINSRVETKSGLTKGRVTSIDDDGNLDILADTGNRYRNCLPSMWVLSTAPEKVAKPKGLKRGDLCHINYRLDGEIWHRNGWIISARTAELFVMFDDLDSAWCSREYCIPGHVENDL